MPSLGYSFFKDIKVSDSIEQLYPTFVETGTWRGDTIFLMEKHFDRLHTVEIKEQFYLEAREKYNGDKISFHLGDSSDVLPKIVSKLTGNTIFFLDGHWSSGNTGRGVKDCPLIEELKAVCMLPHAAIIIIDDCRPAGGVRWRDWEGITESAIFAILDDRLEQTYYLPSPLHKEDRLVIHMNQLNN